MAILSDLNAAKFLKANFLGWVGVIMFCGITLSIASSIGRDVGRLSLLLVAGGTTWNLCVALFFPILEILTWKGVYKKEPNLKGQTGVKANDNTSLVVLVATYLALSFITSILLHSPALFLVGMTAENPRPLINLVLIYTTIMAVSLGLLSTYIARLRANIGS